MATQLRWVVKQGDTEPVIRATVRSVASDDPVNLSGASVVFVMTDVDGVEIINKPALIESPANNGIVRYDWVVADTALFGSFDAEFQVTLGSGAPLTAPNSGYIEIRIDEKL